MPNISPFWNDRRDPKPTPSIHCVVQVSASAPNIKITIASARCTLRRLRKEAAMHLGGMAGTMESCWERDENMLPCGKSPNSHNFCMGNCRGSYAVLLSYSYCCVQISLHVSLKLLRHTLSCDGFPNRYSMWIPIKHLDFPEICLRQNPLPNGKLLYTYSQLANWCIPLLGQV